MQQWWDALGQLYAMLQDSDALALSREARRRLIVAIGALDKALLNCATVDCPIRSTVQETQPTQPGAQDARTASSKGPSVEAQSNAAAAMQTCATCRWWARHRTGMAVSEGVCLLTKTENSVAAGASRSEPANTLARAAANDPQVGAVLLTQLPYACSQWAPL